MNLCSCLFLLTRYFVVYCKRVVSIEIKGTCLSDPSLNSGMDACKGGRFQTFTVWPPRSCWVLRLPCSSVSLTFPYHVLCLSLQRRREVYTSVSFMLNCSAFCSYGVKSTQNPNNYCGGEIRFSSLLLFLILRDLFSSLFQRIVSTVPCHY